MARIERWSDVDTDARLTDEEEGKHEGGEITRIISKDDIYVLVPFDSRIVYELPRRAPWPIVIHMPVDDHLDTASSQVRGERQAGQASGAGDGGSNTPTGGMQIYAITNDLFAQLWDPTKNSSLTNVNSLGPLAKLSPYFQLQRAMVYGGRDLGPFVGCKEKITQLDNYVESSIAVV
ncbi:hypothetical protein C8Q74DRAFT_1217014 [Fomes fomentarius]|nr:hypothetical protein C8Q74DRAFT_1217014 [Fomes fomentarius]